MAEVNEEAYELAFELFGLDAFQRIVVAELLRDLEGTNGMPEPGSLEEAKLIELGGILRENL